MESHLFFRNARGGFSLVEILVTLIVLSVLSLLLLGGVSRFKTAAVQAGDTSNLRQIGAAAFQYMGDHNNRIPPIVADDGSTVYDALARYLGIEVDLRDPNVVRAKLGVLISPGDTNKPPKLSALRSYGVNFYMGDHVDITNDSKITSRYLDVIKPSRVIYWMPAAASWDNPFSLMDFSENTYPIAAGGNQGVGLRFDSRGNGLVLWADGHIESISLQEIRQFPGKFLYPKHANK